MNILGSDIDSECEVVSSLIAEQTDEHGNVPASRMRERQKVIVRALASIGFEPSATPLRAALQHRHICILIVRPTKSMTESVDFRHNRLC